MSARDRRLAGAIERWFSASARELPWRETGPDGRRDAYRALVSEFMLQQTQVSRVVDRFAGFVERFPTAGALAGAPEEEVLGLWSGLGYYRRARNLHACARAIVDRYGGETPADAAELRTLPGVGRYTAGAISSMVFGRREPIVDGNVRRVLLRVEGRDADPASSETESWLWDRARALVEASTDPGAFNEGLMELGATVCTPRAPDCAACPVRRSCVARREGRQAEIPRPKARAARSSVYCASVRVEDGAGRLLVERRPDSGLWAGMWQAPTLERTDRPPTEAEAGDCVGLAVARAGTFDHATTHRAVTFDVWTPRGPVGTGAASDRDRRWLEADRIAELPLSSPQRRILLGDAGGAGGPGGGAGLFEASG